MLLLFMCNGLFATRRYKGMFNLASIATELRLKIGTCYFECGFYQGH